MRKEATTKAVWLTAQPRTALIEPLLFPSDDETSITFLYLGISNWKGDDAWPYTGRKGRMCVCRWHLFFFFPSFLLHFFLVHFCTFFCSLSLRFCVHRSKERKTSPSQAKTTRAARLVAHIKQQQQQQQKGMSDWADWAIAQFVYGSIDDSLVPVSLLDCFTAARVWPVAIDVVHRPCA